MEVEVVRAAEAGEAVRRDVEEASGTPFSTIGYALAFAAGSRT